MSDEKYAGQTMAYVRALREQGIWADGCSVLTCGPTTGHFVKAIAYCDRPESAIALAAFFDASAMSAGTAETAQQAQGQRPASATAEGRDAQPEGPLP